MKEGFSKLEVVVPKSARHRKVGHPASEVGVVALETFVVRATFAVNVAPAVTLVESGVLVRD